jgi:hypothetical protein
MLQNKISGKESVAGRKRGFETKGVICMDIEHNSHDSTLSGLFEPLSRKNSAKHNNERRPSNRSIISCKLYTKNIFIYSF